MRIITGRSSSGKTQLILDEIARSAEQCQGRQLLIVPELFSHAYERRLAAATQNHGARTAEVLTFSRLAGRVFAEAGGLADTVLSPAGRLLTLQEAVRRTAAGLKVYPSAVNRSETVRELLRVIDEMKCYDVAPETFFSIVDALDPSEDTALIDKLRDLAQISTMYDYLCEQTLSDPRDALSLLAARLPECRSLDNATIYLDAFNGLTPQELQVVEQLLKHKLSITAAITCDLHEEDIFPSGCRMAKTLRRMAERLGYPAEWIDLGRCRRQRPADLAALEEQVLLPSRTERLSDQQSLRLYAAASPFDECEYAAAHIRSMVRDHGARYQDFVITARDLSTYAAALEMAMARYEVPVFLSEKADLLHKPPLALVTLALQTVTHGWRYEDFFGCLRTGLCTLTAEETDLLEEYALLWRIQGGAWCKPFTGHPDGYGLPFDEHAHQSLAALNMLRERAASPFIRLAEQMQTAQTATEFAAALYDFLEAADVPAHMEDRANAHETAGRLQLAEEYRQLWEILVAALEQFAWTCGNAPMDAQRFAQLFAMVLGEYDVGTIPVSLDRVTCGSLERVCGENVKHVILLGLNDGVLPKAPTPGGVLTETDRLALDNYGVRLSAFGAERMLMEQELLYRALACPTQSLLLCWHEADESGKETRPSYLVGSIVSMLSGVPLENAAELAGRHHLQAERPCIELACAYLSGSRTDASCAAYEYFQKDERVLRAAKQRISRGPLSCRNVVHALYGTTLRLTASRVDTFYSCRFAFFMQYGLRAKPRRVAEFAAPEAGSFIHFVLENTLSVLGKREGGVGASTNEDAHTVMKTFVQQYINEQLGGLDGKPTRFRYLFGRLIKTMESILANVLEELRVSDFAPIDYELDFSTNGDLPPVSVADEQVSAQLSGKVDRVDGYMKNGRLYLRVMDYKSGRKSFSLSDIWYGLNMQLVLYLYALQDEGLARYRERLSRELYEIVPAGVLYVPTREELLDAERDTDEATLRALREKALRRSGLVTDNMEILNAMEHGLAADGRFIPVKISRPKKGEDSDPSPVSGVADLARFGRLARYAQSKLIEMGHSLADGDVRCDPCQNGQHAYCAWCDFRAACQFDETAGDSLRVLRNVMEKEFWEKVERGENNGDKMDG